MKNPQDQVNSLINHLTDDEDQRQSLWVHYLSGNPTHSFVSHLEKIRAESIIECELQARLWHVLKNPPSEKFTKLLSSLSNTEQSVACLLALGLTISQISKYKEVNEVRIRQVISVMRDNDCWEELYAKEKIDRG